MNPLKIITTPEYLFRPRQVLARLSRQGRPPQSIEEVTLPWGARILVHPNENIGSDIFWYGVFDKIVPESIARLLDPGELAIDVGANIGQNTSLMAARSGPQGQVLAFEPHPEIGRELRENVLRWKTSRWAEIQVEAVAMGGCESEGSLGDGSEFTTNRGSASLQSTDSSAGHRVRIVPLDHYLKEGREVGVCKVDVEGHELEVFRGAARALAAGQIRDIVFEDFAAPPSPVGQCLAGHGYTLFGLSETWWKPRLIPMTESGRSRSFNYLASLNPERAKKRFRAPGWKCLMNTR